MPSRPRSGIAEDASPAVWLTDGAGYLSYARDGSARILGWRFRTRARPLRAVALGVYDEGGTGLVVAHDVALFATTKEQASLARTAVPAGRRPPQVTGPGTAVFRYAPIDAVPLEPGTDYVLAATSPGHADAFHNFYRWNGTFTVPGGVQTDPRIELLYSQYLFGTAELQYPAVHVRGRIPSALLGPNLLLLDG